jgi:hypothetical protein
MTFCVATLSITPLSLMVNKEHCQTKMLHNLDMLSVVRLSEKKFFEFSPRHTAQIAI